MKTVAELSKEELAILIWQVTLSMPVEYSTIQDPSKWRSWSVGTEDIVPWLLNKPTQHGISHSEIYLRVKAK